jgi:hypothetical protein
VPLPSIPLRLAFIYEVLETEIIVVAVPHLMQKPGYWHDRLGL